MAGTQGCANRVGEPCGRIVSKKPIVGPLYAEGAISSEEGTTFIIFKSHYIANMLL